MSNDKDERKHRTKTSSVKIVAIAVSAVLVAAGFLAATGSFASIIAYAQQGYDSEMTTFEEEARGSEDTTTTSDTSASTSSDNTTASSNDTATQSDETTTASAIVSGSTCAPAMTASDVGIDDVTTTADLVEDEDALGEDRGEADDEEDNGSTSTSGATTFDNTNNSTATASTTGLNDTQSASIDALIESACEAIRDGKSVTALGFLATIQEMLNDADDQSGTETAAQTVQQEDDDTVEDEDEPGDIDTEDNVEDESEDDE